MAALLGTAVAHGETGCVDISKTDFRNRTISVAGRNTPKGWYGDEGLVRTFQFRRGEAVDWAWGPGWGPMPPEVKAKPDFQTTIEQDVLIRPEGSRGVRVLYLDMVHLTGTGQFGTVVAFDCRGGRVHKVFEASGEGVFLRGADARYLWVSSEVWQKEDAHCCPTRERHMQYRWDPRRQGFVPLSAEMGPSRPW